jgi:hypothetical protein
MVSSVKEAPILLPFLTATQHVYNKNLSSQCDLIAQIEPVQDKI